MDSEPVWRALATKQVFVAGSLLLSEPAVAVAVEVAWESADDDDASLLPPLPPFALFLGAMMSVAAAAIDVLLELVSL